MKTHLSALLTLSVLLTTTSLAFAQQQKPNPSVVKNYGKLPLSFEKNIGQTDKRVKFFSRGSGYSLFLTPKEAVFSLKKSSPKPKGKQATHAKPEQTVGAVLRMQLVGANPEAQETTEAKLPGTTNYFVGKDKSQWRTGVENYGKVGFNEVYKGVDVVYYGNQSQLEYDFVVKPKAEASSIRLKFAGARRVKSLPSGELLLETGNGSMKWHSPVAYQEVAGKRKPVQAKYHISKGNEVCFAVGAYDRSRPLVIDPALVYSTYLGGKSYDVAYALAVDSKGSAYVAGWTISTDFPTTTGAFQTQYKGAPAFVTKLSADGKSLVYSTYLGGTNVKDEIAYAIAVDSGGSAYVAGYTRATDFPTTTGAFQTQYKGGEDGFVTKLSADGKSLVYSTYLGGKSSDYAYAIAVDSGGSAYVAGYTRATDFPTTTGAFQTQYKGGEDGFVTKLSADGKSLVYSTYLGGGSNDVAYAIAVDSGGSAYAAGYTRATDFPTTTGAFQTQNEGGGEDGFVTKLSADGKSLVYSTYLGGGGDDWAYAIAVDSGGSAYVAGSTGSTAFPTTTGAFQTQLKGSRDAFVTKFNLPRSLILIPVKALYGGEATTGTVLLDSIATADTKIAVASDSPLVTHPSSVIVPKGADSANFSIVTSATTQDTEVRFTTTPVSKLAYTPLWVVIPRTLTKLTVPASLRTQGVGTVTLNAPALEAGIVVKLKSDNALLTVPSSVTVPSEKDSVTFPMSVGTVTVATSVKVTAEYNGVKITKSVKLLPYALTKLAVPAALIFGTQGVGSVTLDAPAPEAGIVVKLTSDNPLLTVPSSVTVPSSENSVTFEMSAGTVTKATVVKVTAEYNGVKITKSVKILPFGLDTFTLSTKNRTGGKSVRGTVTAKGAVPAGGLVVTLTSDKAEAVVPASVTIPVGKTSATFIITTTTVSATVTVKLDASNGTVQLSQLLRLKP